MQSETEINRDAETITTTTEIIDITFKNIVYSVENKKQNIKPSNNREHTDRTNILDGVSGIFKSGEITAIMGASGAGKTTLMNILTGRSNNFSGEILANDTPYNSQNFGEIANYVTQNDILMSTLTVRETLQFGAKLRINDLNQAKLRINSMVKKLKLQKCLNVSIGGQFLQGVSGGQKKRTAIAFELIGQPKVMALDEPTSGMDSLTSFVIVSELSSLAKAGHTVFMTIHQPNSEIFALFDKLMLLVEGRFIYQGKAANTIQYFANNFGQICPQFQNPADYFMSLMHHSSQQNQKRFPLYFDIYSQQINPQIDKQIEDRCHNPLQPYKQKIQFLTVLSVLIKRDCLNIIRNPILMASRIFMIVFTAIYIGGICFNAGRKDYTDIINWKTITGFLFFIQSEIFNQIFFTSVVTFHIEREVFLKEESAKLYGVVPYFLSRNIIQIPYLFALPLLFQLISYWMLGLGNTPEQFFFMYFALFAQVFTASSTGMFISTVFQSSKAIQFTVGAVFTILVIFGGFYKNLDNLSGWIGWVRYISPFNYCYTAIVQNQVIYKDSLIQQLNMDFDKWPSVFILLSLGVLFRFLACILLWCKKGKFQ